LKNQIIYLDFNGLLASAEKKGILENFGKIEMASVNALDFKEGDEILKIGYTNPKGKQKSTSFNFSIPGSREKVAAAISEMKGFEREEVAESTTKALLMNILGLLATVIGTGLFVWISNESAAGVEYTSSGRRGASNEAVYEMLGNIPSELIILIGVGTFGWFAYKAYQRYQNPQTETHFS